jgi:inhibitor of KinA sporulation pathway (predicted exonuclease)
MNYIVFDLEFNQDFSSLQDSQNVRTRYPYEIIQFGAIKLDVNFNTVSTFNRYIKPTIYTQISPFVTELTGITTEQLQIEETFSKIYKAYTEFISDPDSVFCVWGNSDMKELFGNIEYHQLNSNLIPRMFMNIQPYASLHLGLSSKKLLRLEAMVEALNLPLTYEFHNALNDAYYTSEIFKKIYDSSIQPRRYDPSYIKTTPRQHKKIIDFHKLIQQFEKMYHRNMTEEEQEIIKLAYKMGKTQQFIK